jgi:hypothetical protein
LNGLNGVRRRRRWRRRVVLLARAEHDEDEGRQKRSRWISHVFLSS